MNDIEQDLFKEEQEEPIPVIGSEKIDFSFLLKDGSNVSVNFERHFSDSVSHFDFYGDMVSETGYRSYFSFDNEFTVDPDDVVIEKAKIIAEQLREELINKIEKESRRKKRKKKE